MDFPRTRAVLDEGLAAGAFPACVIEVGNTGGAIWTHALGRLRRDDSSPPATIDTIFDLASLTKVIATTSLVMREVERGRMEIDAPVHDLFPLWSAAAQAGITLRHLLDHSSGLPAHARLWERLAGRHAFEELIFTVPFETPPGTASVYSDLGFILLGFALETTAGVPLAEQWRALASRLDVAGLQFTPPADWRSRIAPTEQDPWRGRLLVGEVHDENAAALGGIAGHAGLFGTAPDVGRFARTVLRTFSEATPLGAPATMALFARVSHVPGSSRALGWDTMRPTSSCGTRLSADAIGHTGFTGTSLWIDRAREVYVVLLANRVHPTRSNELFAPLRPRVHDAVVADLEAAGEA